MPKTWNYHGEQVPRRDVIRYRGLAFAADICLAGYVIWLVGWAITPAVIWTGAGMMVLSVVVLAFTQHYVKPMSFPVRVRSWLLDLLIESVLIVSIIVMTLIGWALWLFSPKWRRY
jgi:hypothetical protein